MIILCSLVRTDVWTYPRLVENCAALGTRWLYTTVLNDRKHLIPKGPFTDLTCIDKRAHSHGLCEWSSYTGMHGARMSVAFVPSRDTIGVCTFHTHMFACVKYVCRDICKR